MLGTAGISGTPDPNGRVMPGMIRFFILRLSFEDLSLTRFSILLLLFFRLFLLLYFLLQRTTKFLFQQRTTREAKEMLAFFPKV